jgi:L-seryl-tRNA(Ser) seleniumtransferase
LTGAEGALVVNNNASALLLSLSALAKGREVIVSRGQAVEIGGGVRIPEIMRQSGAKLIEVGTTNCTYLADYEAAIAARTVALLRVHSSNFRLVGFTESVPLEQLVRLSELHDLLVLDDLGSGCLLDTTKFGLIPEPMVQQSIASHVGLAFFSGDKLLGGPQAGLIVGKKLLVDKLKKHPLARAVRIDKIRLAGLAATLRHYLKGEELSTIPIWRMVSTPLDAIERRADRWAQSLGGLAAVIDGESVVGGGSLPGGTLPTKLLALKGHRKHLKSVQELARGLRCQQPPVIVRLEGNRLLLDPRTVLPEDDDALLQAVRSVWNARDAA